MRIVVLSALACAALSTITLADTAETPDGSITLSGGSVAAGIGWSWGSGQLVYQNKTHDFKISGLSVVDVGAASISASGNVYHLAKLEDFPGNYTAASAGFTIAGGGEGTYLKNSHGVVIKLTASTKGLKFNLSAQGMTIKLTS